MCDIMAHKKSSMKNPLLLFYYFIFIFVNWYHTLLLLDSQSIILETYTFLGSWALSFASILHTSVVEGALIDNIKTMSSPNIKLISFLESYLRLSKNQRNCIRPAHKRFLAPGSTFAQVFDSSWPSTHCDILDEWHSRTALRPRAWHTWNMLQVVYYTIPSSPVHSHLVRLTEMPASPMSLDDLIIQITLCLF